jgi:hypothetical protein
MTVQNDVEWTKIEIPRQANSGNSGNSGAPEEGHPECPEQAIKAETPSKDLVPTGVTGVPETATDRLAASKARLRATWIPPDIWSQNRPSLLQVIAHAWYGDWGPKTGPWRLAGRIDAVLFGVPLVALFYSLAWIAERFSRRLCAIILYSAVAWWLNWIWWF